MTYIVLTCLIAAAFFAGNAMGYGRAMRDMGSERIVLRHYRTQRRKAGRN